MAIEKDLLDQLLAGRDPKDVFNKDGLVDELKKALSERILNTELDEHLDSDGAEGKSNHRNGYSKKSVLTGTSKMTLSVPRDRAGTFDPKLIAKYQRGADLLFEKRFGNLFNRRMGFRRNDGRHHYIAGFHGFSSNLRIDLLVELVDEFGGRVLRHADAIQGILAAARLPAHILQKPAHRVEFRAEARPVSGFQALDCLIVVVERLARPICRGACERRSRCSTRGRRRGAGFRRAPTMPRRASPSSPHDRHRLRSRA